MKGDYSENEESTGTLCHERRLFVEHRKLLQIKLIKHFKLSGTSYCHLLIF